MQRPHRQYLLRTSMGFITSAEDLEKLIAEDRLQPVMVRCGSGRFVCPAQDVKHFTAIINKDGSDYVRDWSVQSDR